MRLVTCPCDLNAVEQLEGYHICHILVPALVAEKVSSERTALAHRVLLKAAVDQNILAVGLAAAKGVSRGCHRMYCCTATGLAIGLGSVAVAEAVSEVPLSLHMRRLFWDLAEARDSGSHHMDWRVGESVVFHVPIRACL